jgi:predicted Fe-Mo cluster-binding NifX family protein
MKIAIPLAAGKMSDHFGHAEQFAIIEADATSKQIIKTTLLTPPPHEPGVLPRWLHQQGANVIIAGGMGQRAKDLFSQSGIEIKTGRSGGTAEELAAAFLNGALASGGASCNHDGCQH